MKHKCPAELNSKVIRVNIGDWQLLMELARQHDTTVAKVLHLAIIGTAKQEQVTITPRTQIPMALTEAYQVIPELAVTVTPKAKFATNGSKAVAFRIKPKGVRRE